MPTQSRDAENVIIRQSVTTIAVGLGIAIGETIRWATQGSDPRNQDRAWTYLADKICDFGEYLDGE